MPADNCRSNGQAVDNPTGLGPDPDRFFANLIRGAATEDSVHRSDFGFYGSPYGPKKTTNYLRKQQSDATSNN